MFASTLIAATLVAPGAPPATPAPNVKENTTKGLKWLAEKQTKEGFWAGSNNTFKLYTSAHAGLALLMEGSTPSEGAYAENIRRAMGWFEKGTEPSGLLVPQAELAEYGRAMSIHAVALLFLASAYDVDSDDVRRKRFAKLLSAAIGYAEERQTARGGWGYGALNQLNEFDDAQMTCMMLQALYAAQRAGLSVPKPMLEKATNYLLAASTPSRGVVSSLATLPKPDTGDAIATVAASVTLLSSPKRNGPLSNWVAFSRRSLPVFPESITPGRLGGNIVQQHFQYARLIAALGDNGHQQLEPNADAATLMRWSPYREKLFAFLKASQGPDGSWPETGGGALTTSTALIMLQLDNSYVSAFGR